MKLVCLLLTKITLLWSYQAAAQQDLILYYDSSQQIVKEVFQLAKDNPQVLEGAYKAYYANGNVKILGHYHQNTASGWWAYFYENGHPKMRGTLAQNVHHGLWEYFYENGRLQMKGAVYDTLRQGLWQFFFEKGSLKSEGSFLDGQKDGLWQYYAEDGFLKAEETFHGDSSTYWEFYASGPLRLKGNRYRGQNEGAWTQYHENGQVQAAGSYHQGVRQGVWKFYHGNGRLASTGSFLNGVSSGVWSYYHENGSKSAEGEEKNGTKEGYWKLYQSNGDFKGQALYGPDGLYQEFYEDSTLKVKGAMPGGVPQGRWQYFDEDGTLEGEAIFNNGTGTYRGCYRNGSLKMKGTLTQGKRTGVWELYKPNGQLAGYYTSVYENDEPVFESLSREPPDAIQQTETATLNPDYLYKKKGLRYFKPRVNEFRGIILGLDPAGLLFHRIPFSIEYYLQERLGYELVFGIERTPFFLSDKEVDANTSYSRGYFIAIKQKFYHADTRSGIFYFGHGLGLEHLEHHANLAEVDALSGALSVPVNTVVAEEQQVSYVLLGGTRLMKDADLINTRVSKATPSPGLTFDVFGGVGIGYRFLSKSYTADRYDHLLGKASRKGLFLPLQVGATIGYVF